jgi:hypothetical protein
MHVMPDDTSRDYTYYRDKGCFGSDYYCPTRLNLLKKVCRKPDRLHHVEKC